MQNLVPLNSEDMAVLVAGLLPEFNLLNTDPEASALQDVTQAPLYAAFGGRQAGLEACAASAPLYGSPGPPAVVCPARPIAEFLLCPVVQPLLV